MLKKSVLIVAMAVAVTASFAGVQNEASVRANVQTMLKAYQQAAVRNDRQAMADWVSWNVVHNFLGVSTPDMSTFNRRSWYSDVMDNSGDYRCHRIDFMINSVHVQGGVAVIRMNIDFRGTRMRNGRRQSYRSYSSYRDTWHKMNGRWKLDTDEERGYKEWANGRLTVSRMSPG